MGYESCVQGEAKGQGLVQQLLDRGFRLDGEQVDAPEGWFTGVLVVDDGTIQGIAEWQSGYGFSDLVQALHQVPGLEYVDLHREGEEQGDVEGYHYEDGAWYVLIATQHLVREDRSPAAEEAIALAVAPFEPPSKAAGPGEEESNDQQYN